MIKRSNAKFSPINVRKTVRVPVPEYDRARNDTKNILAAVLDKRDDLYKLGTHHGKLDCYP